MLARVGVTQQTPKKAATHFLGSGVLGSCNHGRHEFAEEGSAAAAGVVHELEEAQV
jgi:hypothetical protein